MAGGSNIASTGIVLEALTRDNYLNWSTLVQNYLMGKDLWVNIVVEGDSSQLNDPDGRIWESKNRQALHAIQLSCGSHALGEIRNCETAHEAWNHLKTVFSEDLKAQYYIYRELIEDYDLNELHRAVKRGLWSDVSLFLRSGNSRDIISQKSSANGWTALHVAVDAGQGKIMEELVKMGALLTEKDWDGYTPLALAAESTDNWKIAELMVSEGGDDLLSMEIKADNEYKGDIPVLLAAAKGHKEMTRYLFSKTGWFILLDDNGYYGAKLLSRCIQAEIFDVAAALLQHHGTQLPLIYEFDQCPRPIYGLTHIPGAYPSGIRLNWCEQIFYNILWLPPYIDLEGKGINLESHDGGSNADALAGIKGIYEIKKNHCLVCEILKCLCKRIENISLEPEQLSELSIHDAMLQAAKYGIIEFIKSMREANSDLLWAVDKNRRGIFAHAILNRQEKVFKLIYEIESQKRLITSIDEFGNNLLHLAAELGRSSYRGLRSNAALQMQRELQWFKAVENIVPPMCKEAKNADGMKPRELFTKNHEQLVNEGRQWAKDTANSFTIVGTLIITIMFAAAFTTPGGNNQVSGSPIFLGKDAFSLFIIADALSLITSSSSVLMFIGILTSRYAEEDFITSLPIKLLFGLLTIFWSVVFMMCAFCATLSLMLKGYRWIILTTIVFAVIPILVFLLSLLRLFLEICISFMKSFSFLAKN